MAPSRAAESAPVLRGRRGHALLGNLREFNRGQLGFYTRCAPQYGNAVPIRPGPSRGLTPGQRVTPTPYITIRPEPRIRMRLERR